MDKSLAKYLNGETNAAQVQVVLSRSILPGGAQHIRILWEDKPLYEFWHSPRRKAKDPTAPKHAGGRKPYLMLMVEELERLREQNIPNIEELIGFLVCLSRNIEWKTGLLVKPRSKKPLQYADLCAMFSGGRGKLHRILSDLKRLGLLSHTKEGYLVASRLIKKG